MTNDFSSDSQLPDSDWQEAIRRVLDEPASADAWAGSNQERQALVRDLSQFTRAIRSTDTAISDSARQRFQAIVESPAPRTVHPIRSAAAPRRRISAWIAGATLCGIAGGVLLFASWGGSRLDADADTIRYTTRQSQQSVIELPDGSHATLAPETQLSYSTQPTGERRVELLGEAVFSVQHDPARPFIVTTGRVATTVLGTRFSVRRYEDDAHVRVAVAEGRVASGGTGAPVLVAKNMVALVTDSTAQLVESATADPYLSWITGHLVFDDTPVPDMLATLRRWYGYEFRLADSTLAKRYITASFKIDDPQKTFRELKALLNVTITQSDSVITLAPSQTTRHKMIKFQSPQTEISAMEAGR